VGCFCDKNKCKNCAFELETLSRVHPNNKKFNVIDEDATNKLIPLINKNGMQQPPKQLKPPKHIHHNFVQQNKHKQ